MSELASSSSGTVSSSRYVVVGPGQAGAATAWSLARRGNEVTVLERSQPAARDGSSHGSARIFRYVYDDPFYVRLVVEAKAGFDEVDQALSQKLSTLMREGPAEELTLTAPQFRSARIILMRASIIHGLATLFRLNREQRCTNNSRSH